jgi:hypothetical protein
MSPLDSLHLFFGLREVLRDVPMEGRDLTYVFLEQRAVFPALYTRYRLYSHGGAVHCFYRALCMRDRDGDGTVRYATEVCDAILTDAEIESMAHLIRCAVGGGPKRVRLSRPFAREPVCFRCFCLLRPEAERIAYSIDGFQDAPDWARAVANSLIEALHNSRSMWKAKIESLSFL